MGVNSTTSSVAPPPLACAPPSSASGFPSSLDSLASGVALGAARLPALLVAVTTGAGAPVVGGEAWEQGAQSGKGWMLGSGITDLDLQTCCSRFGCRDPHA